jgi:hypothetical protein
MYNDFSGLFHYYVTFKSTHLQYVLLITNKWQLIMLIVWQEPLQKYQIRITVPSKDMSDQVYSNFSLGGVK